jgi:CRISPR/Cas system-associated protein Csx1
MRKIGASDRHYSQTASKDEAYVVHFVTVFCDTVTDEVDGREQEKKEPA